MKLDADYPIELMDGKNVIRMNQHVEQVIY
jgi:hypothetical protein